MGWMLLTHALSKYEAAQEEKQQLLTTAGSLPTAKDVNAHFSWSPAQAGQPPVIELTRSKFRATFGADGATYNFGELIPLLNNWAPGSLEERAWKLKCDSLPRWLQRALRRLVRKALSNEDDGDVGNRKPMRLFVGWNEDPSDPDRWEVSISYAGKDAEDHRRIAKVMIYGRNLGA
jgi:hypothetical protein